VDVSKYSPEQDGNGVYDDEEGFQSNTFHQQVKELNLAGQNVTLPAIGQSLHSLLPLILSILKSKVQYDRNKVIFFKAIKFIVNRVEVGTQAPEYNSI